MMTDIAAWLNDNAVVLGAFAALVAVTVTVCGVIYKLGSRWCRRNQQITVQGTDPAAVVRDPNEWQQRWHDLSDTRREFWRLIRIGYKNWGYYQDDRSLQDVIGASRFPTDLPLDDGQEFPKWVWDAPDQWDAITQRLNQFAGQIYPEAIPAESNKTQLMGGTNEFDRFDDLRRELSKFWDHWGRQEPLEEVIREQNADGMVRSSTSEIKLLTFLEIAYSRWAQTGASGKGGLFTLGKRNAETE